MPQKIVRTLWKQATQSSAAGRKAGFDWDALHAEAIRRFEDNGHPLNISASTNDLLLWCAEQFGEDKAPDLRARPQICREVARWMGALTA